MARAAPLLAAALATALAGCGGAQDEPVPVATIVVPSAAGARTIPGGRLSFEGACANVKLPASHVWDFAGADPASSTSLTAVVAFPAPGTYRVSYRCNGADGTSSQAVSRAVVVAPASPSLVQIEPQFLTSLAASSLEPALDAAIATITSVVTGPSPGLDGEEPAWSDCGNVPISTHAGRFLVLVDVEPIDGTGGMVALSSPCYVRTSDGLPYVGIMRFDQADVLTLSAQRLQAVVSHELLHVLGFGTLWDQQGLPLLISGKGTVDPLFAGPNARAAFRDFDGGASDRRNLVPLENSGGTGSRDRHWRETVFGSELMTAYLGTASPLSRTTLEALVDQGWQVNAELADPFLVSTSTFAASLLQESAPLDLGDDALPIVPQLR
jgi:hypothetical protein